ncbi:glycoside hydrolase family 43 protein [Echinicola jeungdonensis]|uniref:Glycoside hydrolase family 43 protein n=1 Tax=Echinicola jeungdonensis TaxID=709343 RepID=A0ABV5JAH6_9BACT|nr:glycoside hydrolase family 43 protein [Echinicola jeungdonensis]MDN3670424.1 glycoside hydrolase family 43 protein [Echinicola jeungdonensis]
MKNFLNFTFLLTLILSCSPKTKGNEQSAQQKSVSDHSMSAYLMVYFKDNDHSLHMALSDDGYSFTDINQGKAVIAGDTIAEQKGIRDPHIYRGPDGTFYLAMTDLHIFAKREGIRETEWQRPGEIYGWGNNRGFVLMKSNDLINWSTAQIRIDKTFEGYDEIGCAWAPETIYDEEEGKLMLYYTMRRKNGLNKMYYSYVNDEFNKLLTAPQLIFQYPKEVSYIDADITKVGGQYHMFYTPHDGMPGIKQAVSDQINQNYKYDSTWYDSEPEASEAPNVWKRIGKEKWVLMYDIYGIQPHNFGFRETTDFKNFDDLGHFNEGAMKATNFSSPKHGTVIHLTANEANKLAEHWDLDMEFE